MTQLSSWFYDNKLTLNADKSSFTIFRSAKKNIPNIPAHIEFLGKKTIKNYSNQVSWDYPRRESKLVPTYK